MKKISVIVPVYNTKKELPKCLNSIINQTYTNIEILCVDDGSTDGSEKIVDDFAAIDCRIKVIHKRNGGESSARNVGLKMSVGEYIAFCDCDDWLDVNMYEVLVNTMEKENVDMVAASWYWENDSECREIKNKLPVNDKVFDRTELLKYLYMRDSYRGFAYLWDKLYKKEILMDKKGRKNLFDESLCLGGDVLYLAEAALNVKRVKYVDQAFYHYYQRKESGCHTKDIRRIRDWLRAYEIIIHKFEQEKIDQKTIDYVKRILAYHSSNAAEIAILNGQENAKKELQSIMRQYEQEYRTLNMQYPQRLERYQKILNS